MKKIGIITVHNNQNYSAVLQAYALQKRICDCGYLGEIINYVPLIEKRNMSIFTNSLVRNIRALLYIKKDIREKSIFRIFF